MSRWPGKYVIGLTGNIATGKSVVRKMLEHLGAFGVDADGLSHRAMDRSGPAYAQVAQTFGELIVGDDGQIDREMLGGIVFANPKALAKLEAIVHPYVRQAVNILAARAQQPVIVVEAIKLLESEIAGWCDSVWVVDVPAQAQIARLMHKRGLTAEQAQLRIAAQPSQNDKIAKADVVIDNSQSFEETWSQVQSHWLRLVPGQVVPDLDDTVAMTPMAPQMTLGAAPTVMVRRGKPADAAAIATFINQSTQNALSLTRADVMAAFGEKAFVLAQVNDSLGALAGWQVENLVTRVDDMYVLDNVPPDLIFKPLLESIETASRELQSEAAFLFVPPALKGGAAAALAQAGYEETSADNLTITAWRDAVRESQPAGALVFFKKLREGRVMRPV